MSQQTADWLDDYTVADPIDIININTRMELHHQIEIEITNINAALDSSQIIELRNPLFPTPTAEDGDEDDTTTSGDEDDTTTSDDEDDDDDDDDYYDIDMRNTISNEDIVDVAENDTFNMDNVDAEYCLKTMGDNGLYDMFKQLATNTFQPGGLRNIVLHLSHIYSYPKKSVVGGF